MITRVTGKNQLTIPAELARELHIGVGSEVEWSRGAESDTLCLRVRPAPAQLLQQVREMGSRYNAKANTALAELERLRDDDAADATPEHGSRQ